MADEKVNMGPEENKPPETLSPPGQGDLPPLEENNAPAVSGEDKTAPDHVEPDPPSADKHTQQTVLPGMGEDTPAPSGKVINLSDIQAADKDGKAASAPTPDKKTPEADKPPKRRGRPPKEQAGMSAGKKEKAAEPRTGRPSKVDKAAREEAPPSVRDKVSRGKVVCQEYAPSCFMQRNRYMAGESQRVIAVYDGRERGGTLFTMRYAHSIGREVREIRI